MVQEPQYGRGEQTIKLGAALVCRHPIRVQRVGTASVGSIERHGSLVKHSNVHRDLRTGQPNQCHQK
jgi:hypothetical protein